MQLQDVIARIGQHVSELSGRIREAEDYAAVLQMRGITSAQGGAYVMPAGMRGGRVQAAVGAFVQDLDEVIAVVLLVPSGDRGLSRRGGSFFSLIHDVIQSLCGWVPDDSIGPFQLVRGAMINLGDGVLAYQIEFSVPAQLRIVP